MPNAETTENLKSRHNRRSHDKKMADKVPVVGFPPAQTNASFDR